jgi:hypothetical protein
MDDYETIAGALLIVFGVVFVIVPLIIVIVVKVCRVRV